MLNHNPPTAEQYLGYIRRYGHKTPTLYYRKKVRYKIKSSNNIIFFVKSYMYIGIYNKNYYKFKTTIEEVHSGP